MIEKPKNQMHPSSSPVLGMIEIDETVKEPKRQFSEYEAVGGFRQGFLAMKTEINAKEGQEIIRGKDRGKKVFRVGTQREGPMD